MSGVLRRFAALGSIITAGDVAVFLVLRVVVGWPVIPSALMAVGLSAPLSYLLNRRFTFGRDPYVRWVQHPGAFVVLAAAAGLLDVTVVAVVAGAVGVPTTVMAALGVRAGGLVAGGAVRVLGYRLILFERVRAEQATRVDRGLPPGDLRLTVVLPAYNEAGRIASAVQTVGEALQRVVNDGGLEVIVVDDGSHDGTAAVAESAGVRVIRLPENAGKGAAVRAGVLAARGRTVAFTDADLSYDPARLEHFMALVEDGWDMVVGSRRHVGTRTLVRSGRLREVTGRLFNVLTHAVLLGSYRDTQCGLKAFRHDIAALLFGHARLDRFAFDVELFHLVERYRLTLVEVPVAVRHSDRSTVRVAVDAARMVRDLLRVRLWAGRGEYDLGAEEAAVVGRDAAGA